MMKPNTIANWLRGIATKIENSHRPSRALVTADLKRIVAALSDMTIAVIFMEGLESTLEDPTGLEDWESAIGNLEKDVTAQGWRVVDNEDLRMRVLLPKAEVPTLQKMVATHGYEVEKLESP